jgi:hypothetical protein
LYVNRVLPLVAVLVLTAGYTSSATKQAMKQTASVAACPPTADLHGLTTQQGIGRGVELAVLLFPTAPQLRARQELKIVFRLTGGQDVTVTADGPHDKVILPVWGPEWHGGSTFDAPGAEFGAGFVFPDDGCWRIRVVNESGVGEVTLRIGRPAKTS